VTDTALRLLPSSQRSDPPHGMIRAACSGRLRVDPKTIEGVGKQLIMLVKQTLGAKGTLPDPFPVETQLSDLGVSSLKMVNLMLAVELEFDIAIPQSDITPENFHSVAAIQSLVVRTLSMRKSV
jgi:acyl carrier protein